MYPHGNASAPAPSAPPQAGPSLYPSLEKPYTNYQQPPPPGPGGYPPQFGEPPRVVEGIPIGPQPQPVGLQTPQAQQPGYWTTGLCDCFSDIGSCCLVMWCPCVAFGRLSEIVDKGSSSCCCNGCLYLGLCLVGAVGASIGIPVSCQWIYSCTYRGKLKQDINMPPSCCDECCVHFWCEPCALCQEYREVQNRGYHLSLGWHGNLEKRRQQGNGMPAMVAAPIAPNMNR